MFALVQPVVRASTLSAVLRCSVQLHLSAYSLEIVACMLSSGCSATDGETGTWAAAAAAAAAAVAAGDRCQRSFYQRTSTARFAWLLCVQLGDFCLCEAGFFRVVLLRSSRPFAYLCPS